MTVVSIHDAKARLASLIEAAAGDEIVISQDGKPVARLVALSEWKEARKPGALRGGVRIGDDFDAPLPPEVASGLGIDV